MKRLMLPLSSLGRHRGFTVVELIIVVVIIVILTAVSVVTYRSAQAGANDKAREADVAAIMEALEKYYDTNNEYPADDQLNPTKSPTILPNFTAVKTLLPTLSEEALSGPGDYKFYASCKDSDCTNNETTWQNYMTKSYRYQSRYVSTTTGGSVAKSTSASYASNTGWGCTVTTYYDDPGYAIAWYSEAKKIWIFKRSAHGTVKIANFGSGPVAPQECSFSY